MRDEIVSAFGHPGEIAHTQLIGRPQGHGNHQTSGIRERLRLSRERDRYVLVQTTVAQPLGLFKVQTQEITAIISHTLILTFVKTLWRLLVSAPAFAFREPLQAEPSSPALIA